MKQSLITHFMSEIRSDMLPKVGAKVAPAPLVLGKKSENIPFPLNQKTRRGGLFPSPSGSSVWLFFLALPSGSSVWLFTSMRTPLMVTFTSSPQGTVIFAVSWAAMGICCRWKLELKTENCQSLPQKCYVFTLGRSWGRSGCKPINPQKRGL